MPPLNTACATIVRVSKVSYTHILLSYSLSNLFNAIPRISPLRVRVYNVLLETATANDELDVLQLSRADVENWLTEWDISPDEKSEFLERIVDAHLRSGQLCVFKFNNNP